MTTPVELLRAYGGYFADRDWVFTTNTGDLKHIRYGSDSTGYHVWWRRAGRFLAGFFARDRFGLGVNGWSNLRHPILHARVTLGKDRNLPDGRLVTPSGGGGVITFWMEDGMYCQLVRPPVGLALADFLEAEPNHPHARRIAAEIERATQDSDRYHQRQPA